MVRMILIKIAMGLLRMNISVRSHKECLILVNCRGGDCDDQDGTIHPGAEDSWYDGIDSDCDEEDDYDQDQDGYVLDEYADSSPLPAGDCNDQNTEYNPGVSDAPYDGADNNCDGKDDFDVDEDGYIPSEYEQSHISVYGRADE